MRKSPPKNVAAFFPAAVLALAAGAECDEGDADSWGAGKSKR